MRDLRRAAETNPDYPPILLVHQGTVAEGTPFFEKLWPDARAIANPDRELYAAFGIERGGSRQFLAPGALACGLRATLKGNVNGRPQGDPRLMPGLFLVADDTILWQHDYRHVGDHPDFATLPTLFPHPPPPPPTHHRHPLTPSPSPSPYAAAAQYGEGCRSQAAG